MTTTSAPIPRLYLNRREAAAACGVSIATIGRARNSGKLRAKKTSPRGRDLYSVEDLKNWFESLEDA